MGLLLTASMIIYKKYLFLNVQEINCFKWMSTSMNRKIIWGYALHSRIYYMLCFTPPMILLPVTGSMDTAC